MKALIDADVIRYEIGSCGEYIDDEGVEVVREFDFVKQLVDDKIRQICEEVWADEPPLLFLTEDEKLNKKLNKRRKFLGEPQKEFKPNFREAIAKTKPYKGNRKSKKPYHFDNITAYLLGSFDVFVAEGMEADDAMSIYQYGRLDKLDTIICSRDKDLRITPGLHYGWECGKQRSFGPIEVSELGEIDIVGGKKIVGTGRKFFYSQLITGDKVDHIPGLPRGGPSLAFKLLRDCETEEECFKAVREAYESKLGDKWEEYMLEQGRLLWMVRELKDGEPVMWELLKEEAYFG